MNYSLFTMCNYVKLEDMTLIDVINVEKKYSKTFHQLKPFWEQLTTLESENLYKSKNGGSVEEHVIPFLLINLQYSVNLRKIVWGLHTDDPSWLVSMIPRWFPNIESIEINCYYVKYTTMEQLAYCTTLRHVNLVLPDVFPDHILTTMFKCNCLLNTVRIHGEFTIENVSALPKSVEHLHVTGFNKKSCILKMKDFLNCSKHLKLRSLNFYGIHNDMYNGYVRDLSVAQPDLEKLEIVFNVDTNCLNMLTKLRILSIIKDQLTEIGINQKLKNMVRKLRNIEELHIIGIYITILNMKYFAYLPLLTTLRFTNCYISKEAYLACSKFKTLTTLKLGWRDTEGNARFNDEDVLSIVNLTTNLNVLDLAEVDVSDLSKEVILKVASLVARQVNRTTNLKLYLKRRYKFKPAVLRCKFRHLEIYF